MLVDLLFSNFPRNIVETYIFAESILGRLAKDLVGDEFGEEARHDLSMRRMI